MLNVLSIRGEHINRKESLKHIGFLAVLLFYFLTIGYFTLYQLVTSYNHDFPSRLGRERDNDSTFWYQTPKCINDQVFRTCLLNSTYILPIISNFNTSFKALDKLVNETSKENIGDEIHIVESFYMKQSLDHTEGYFLLIKHCASDRIRRSIHCEESKDIIPYLDNPEIGFDFVKTYLECDNLQTTSRSKYNEPLFGELNKIVRSSAHCMCLNYLTASLQKN